MPEVNEQLDERRAYLLDVSLFIFEFLNPSKIIKNSSKEGVILEVPSALVTMIWSSMTGSNILQNLIYAYLIGLRNNGTFARNADEQIRKLANATDEELKNYGHSAYDNIISVYAQIIDGATKQGSKENTIPSIGRYEPILAEQSADDLTKMRTAYSAEFGVSAHPLYDLYFLQIYHAQLEGIAASQRLRRIFVLFGSKMSDALGRWKGVADPRTLSLDVQERYKRHLRWFFEDFIYDHLTDKAIKGTLAIGVTFIGVAAGSSIGLISGVPVAAVVAQNIVQDVLIESVAKSPHLNKNDKDFLVPVIIFGAIVFCACLVIALPSTRAFLFGAPTQVVAEIMPVIVESPTVANLGQPTITFTVQPLIPTATETQFPVPFPTINAVPTSSLLPYSEIGYCMYVIQPGDTLQSVSVRFQVNEGDLRASDRIVEWGAFSTNQMIRVNAPCCRPANVNGFSYTVRYGETLYSVAQNNAVSVSELTTVNNLFDSSYIQAGQMLCVPFP